MGPLGQRLKEKMERSNLSCRDVENLSGISASTVSRICNGGEYSGRAFRLLNAWLLGEPELKQPPRMVKRFKVGKETFLVTIEKILPELSK